MCAYVREEKAEEGERERERERERQRGEGEKVGNKVNSKLNSLTVCNNKVYHITQGMSPDNTCKILYQLTTTNADKFRSLPLCILILNISYSHYLELGLTIHSPDHAPA